MKKLLISVNELNCGGTEVAMINMLKNLDKSKYDITLLLGRKRGVYLSKIPEYIKIIEIPFLEKKNRYYICNDESLIKNKWERLNIKFNRKIMNLLDKILKRVNYNFDLYYKYLLRKTTSLNNEYDLAIDYLGYGYFQSAYIAEKVKAKNKVMWIHDEKLTAISRTRCYFNKYSHFFGVSKACVKSFSEKFTETKDKVSLFYNFIDEDEVLSLSKKNIDNKLFLEDKLNILTVGRLEWQKGYDLAIEIANKLKENNIEFRWYVLGDGSCKKDLEKQVDFYKLKDEFIFLGRIDNPYPYIKKADLYVQPSRHEGYGLAIAEARILNKCIVATDLQCIREQIINEVNGYLVPFDLDAFYNIISRLYGNRELISKIEKNTVKSKKSKENRIQELELFM